MIDRIEITVEPKYHSEKALIPVLEIRIKDGLKTEFVSTNVLWPPGTLRKRFDILFDTAKEQLWKLIKEESKDGKTEKSL